MKMIFKAMVAASAVLVLAGPGFAQTASIGEEEFAERCATCHGVNGAGDGMVGALFAQKPRDLRMLSKERGGSFPLIGVLDAIEGNREIVAHGSEMPIWGEYLMAEALEDRGINPKDAAMIVSGRVLSLVYYIHSIQQ